MQFLLVNKSEFSDFEFNVSTLIALEKFLKSGNRRMNYISVKKTEGASGVRLWTLLVYIYGDKLFLR